MCSNCFTVTLYNSGYSTYIKYSTYCTYISYNFKTINLIVLTHLLCVAILSVTLRFSKITQPFRNYTNN